jgi:kinetochore protein Spc7/SPC105
MNFNNPDDVYSSSPLSGDNQSPGNEDGEGSVSEDDEVEDAAAPDSDNSSQSSARLDAALRQAYTQAGTQKLDLEGDGDMTMDIAEDEVSGPGRESPQPLRRTRKTPVCSRQQAQSQMTTT